MGSRSLSFWTSAILVGAVATAGCAGSLRAVYVEVGPPAPIVEVQPACPEPTYVWVPGHWAWHPHDYYWVKGSWVRPRPGRVWAPGEWVRTDRGWGWKEGHWKQQARQEKHEQEQRHSHRHGGGHIE